MTLHLNKLESSSPKDSLCQVLLKMAQWFWRRRFLKVLNVFLLFRNYLPFEKGVAHHLNKFESPLTKNAFCQVWLKLDQLFWRRRFFKVANLFLLFPNYRYLPFGKDLPLEQTWIPFISIFASQGFRSRSPLSSPLADWAGFCNFRGSPSSGFHRPSLQRWHHFWPMGAFNSFVFR